MEALLALDGIGRSALAPTTKPASLRTCSWIAAIWEVGKEMPGPFFRRRPVQDAKLFGRAEDPKSFVGFHKTKTRKNARAGTIDGRARTLRAKYKAYTQPLAPDEVNWRGNVAACLIIAYGLPPRIDARKAEDAKLRIMKHAAWAGEVPFAITCIFPLIDAKLAPPE